MTVSIQKQFFQLQRKIYGLSDGQARITDFTDDLDFIYIEIIPNDGPYKNGKFNFVINLTQSDYNPVVVFCKTAIYHPNIDQFEGEICLSMFDEWDSELNDLQDCVQGLLFLLYHPNLDDPYNAMFGGDDLTEENFLKNVRTSLEGGVVDGVPFPRNIVQEHEESIPDDLDNSTQQSITTQGLENTETNTYKQVCTVEEERVLDYFNNSQQTEQTTSIRDLEKTESNQYKQLCTIEEDKVSDSFNNSQLTECTIPMQDPEKAVTDLYQLCTEEEKLVKEDPVNSVAQLDKNFIITEDQEKMETHHSQLHTIKEEPDATETLNVIKDRGAEDEPSNQNFGGAVGYHDPDFSGRTQGILKSELPLASKLSTILFDRALCSLRMYSTCTQPSWPPSEKVDKHASQPNDWRFFLPNHTWRLGRQELLFNLTYKNKMRLVQRISKFSNMLC